MDKVKTIVYASETGFTRKYAQLLAGKLGLKICDHRQTFRRVKRKEPIIYMGWIMAGRIKGLRKARSRFNVCAVCGVGMGFPHESITMKLVKDNGLEGIPFFYMQGGVNPKALGVFKKHMLGLVADSLNGKDQRNAEEDAILEMIEHGGSYVNTDIVNRVAQHVKRFT